MQKVQEVRGARICIKVTTLDNRDHWTLQVSDNEYHVTFCEGNFNETHCIIFYRYTLEFQNLARDEKSVKQKTQ